MSFLNERPSRADLVSVESPRHSRNDASLRALFSASGDRYRSRRDDHDDSNTVSANASGRGDSRAALDKLSPLGAPADDDTHPDSIDEARCFE